MLAVKSLPANAGDIRDVGLISVFERSPGGGNGNPLQYSYLQNPWIEEPVGYSSLGCWVVRYVKQLCVHTSMKVNQTTFWGYIHHLLWPTLCLWSVFLSEQIYFLPTPFSFTELFLWWAIKNLNYIRFWNQVCDLSWKIMGFGQVWVPAHGFKS